MTKRFFITILVAVAIAGVAAAQEKAKHVILIGLDGWGAYSVEKADIPNIKKMMKEGSYTLKKRSVLPSSSAVNWASMFMGAGPELHGYTEWGSKTPELPSRIIAKNGIFPTVFQLLRNKQPNAEIDCIYDWDGIKNLIDTMSVNYYEKSPDYEKFPGELCTMAEQVIAKKPTLAAIIFDEPDHVGHTVGHDTPDYYSTLNRLDGYVGRILSAIEKAGIADETIVILTADHGGIEKGHGGKTMLEMETPFIICGKGVKSGYCFDDISMMQFDVAATIAYIFDLDVPQVWIGHPVTQVFK